MFVEQYGEYVCLYLGPSLICNCGESGYMLRFNFLLGLE